MKQWEDLTPTMSSAHIMINSRNKLWQYVRDNANLDAVEVGKIMKTLRNLNEQIKRRTFTDEQVTALLDDVKRYSRNYGRIAKKLKKSKRSVNFVLKQTKKKKKNENQNKKTKPSVGRQTTIY